MLSKNLQILPKDFYAQSTIGLAKNLLGKYLLLETETGLLGGKIVETEAYLQNDPSSHSFLGPNVRNSSMFAVAGTVYVYLIYGLYWCLNISSNKEGVGEAILIRALEPIFGLETMQMNRKNFNGKIKNLCSGPAKLTMALGINKSFDGLKIWEKSPQKPLFIAQDLADLSANSGFNKSKIVTTTRVGISKAADLPLRFYLSGNQFISKM